MIRTYFMIHCFMIRTSLKVCWSLNLKLTVSKLEMERNAQIIAFSNTGTSQVRALQKWMYHFEFLVCARGILTRVRVAPPR